MISNPIKVFVDGNNEKEFLYEGGTILYHFCPYDNGLSKYFDCNVVFFADSPGHAIDVLKRMFAFVIKRSNEYIVNKPKGRHRAEKIIDDAQVYLDALNDGKVKVEVAPRNQFYRVGWADNDTIY